MSDEAIPGGLNEDNLAALTTPTADTPMTDHAEQHSALTDLMKEASDEFVFQDMEITQLDSEVEDISDFLGGVDFTVNYGTASWTYDSRSNPPNQGHFWSDSTGLSVRENEYVFSKESNGMVEVDWDKAIVGDTLSVTEIGNAEDFGIYLITEIVPDDSYYHYKVVMTSGNHALNSGQKYECSVTHKEKQFSSGFEHTHDLEEDAIAVNRRDIDDIVGYLDGTDSEMYLGSGTWIVDQVSSGPTPSDTQHLWMDDLDFNKVTKFIFARNPVGGADPSWDIVRPGDELYTQLDYVYNDNHGNFLVNYFEQQDIDGNPSENGQYYYFEVEPLEGKSTKGAAEAGQAVTGSITHYGLEFPDDSLSGGEIDLSHEHEAAPPVAIGEDPPSDEESKDGDLWWDSDRMEMFIRYQDAWITTNALSARVEAGEQVQAELLDRVAAGEEIQRQLEPTVAKNAQDIQVLKANLQDRMEMVTIESADWAYAGEDNVSPRQGQFSTDNWFFNQTSLLVVGQKNVGNANWTDVQVGDEVRVTYNNDQDQPWDDRYFGRYVITEITDASGDNLTCTVEFLEGTGTIANGKAYTITIRGLRSDAYSMGDLADDLDDLHKQVDRIDDTVQYRQRPIPWKYKSVSTAPGDLKPGEFTARTSGSESNGVSATIDFYLNEFDACGMRWYPSYGGDEYWHDLSGMFMLSLGLLGDGISIHAKTGRWTFNFGGNGYAKISGNYRKQNKSLMANFLYILNFPGYLPMFATDKQITRVFALEDESPDGEVPFEIEEGNSK